MSVDNPNLRQDLNGRWKAVYADAITPGKLIFKPLEIDQVSGPAPSRPTELNLKNTQTADYRFSLCNFTNIEQDTAVEFTKFQYPQFGKSEFGVFKDSSKKSQIIFRPKKDPVNYLLARALRSKGALPMMLVDKFGEAEVVLFDYHTLYDFKSGEVTLDLQWAGDLNNDKKSDIIIGYAGETALMVSLDTFKKSTPGDHNNSFGPLYKEFPYSNSVEFAFQRATGNEQSNVEFMLYSEDLKVSQKIKNNETWWGIFQDAAKQWYSKPVKLNVTEYKQRDDEGNVIQTLNQVKCLHDEYFAPVFLVKNLEPKLKANYKFHNEREPYGREKPEYSDKNVKLVFRKRKDPLPVFPVSLTSHYREGANHILAVEHKNTESLLADVQLRGDESDDVSIDLVFAGDLNGDDFADFLFRYGPTYRSKMYTMFISNKDGEVLEYIPSKAYSPWEEWCSNETKMKAGRIGTAPLESCRQ